MKVNSLHRFPIFVLLLFYQKKAKQHNITKYILDVVTFTFSKPSASQSTVVVKFIFQLFDSTTSSQVILYFGFGKFSQEKSLHEACLSE